MTLPSSERVLDTGRSSLTVYLLLALIGWSAVVLGSLIWSERMARRAMVDGARIQARASFEKDLLYRRWNAISGGVYAEISETVQPNPYLKVPEREITTPGGRALTLVNPAYMTRLVHEMERTETGISAHITSLKLLRPENAPDPWERRALEAFERGETEVSEVIAFEGVPALRLMRPLLVEAPCLRCHGAQGYKLGDVRGGISESLPLAPIAAVHAEHLRAMRVGHLVVWSFGLFLLILGGRSLRGRILERDAAVRDRAVALERMKQADEQVKTLHGILPICMHCRKILTDAGSWDPLEDYVAAHTDTTYSHGLCPECLHEHYPDT